LALSVGPPPGLTENVLSRHEPRHANINRKDAL
jgi:hypothetical protein